MSALDKEPAQAAPAETDDHELLDQVRTCLVSALHLAGGADALDRDTRLLGGLPELDSMAVVTVILALEEYFGFEADDDEISAATFETLGTLCAFVRSKT